MFSGKRLCPYCLEDAYINRTINEDKTLSYSCRNCQSSIDPLYLKSYKSYPPVVLNVVGFRAHGKTVFLSALFYAFRLFKLNRYWPMFSYLPVNHSSQKLILDNARMLQEGSLPEPTQQIFPEPTMILADGLPFVKKGKATLLIYDAAGESFEAPDEMITYAGFVKRASTVFFLINIPRIRASNELDIASEMDRLLSTYIQGMTTMNAQTKKQRLLVIFTCADEMIPELPISDVFPAPHIDLSLKSYITQDSIANTEEQVPFFDQGAEYVARMHTISKALESYTQHKLQAKNFVLTANKHFESVEYSIISALGFSPQVDGMLPATIDSKRLLDPFLWLLQYSATFGNKTKINKAIRRLRNASRNN